MSRILRRPMFRGGPVSSYGTGIAAPLVPGYQGGGQIGGGIIYGKPTADGRYGFADPLWIAEAKKNWPGMTLGSATLNNEWTIKGQPIYGADSPHGMQPNIGRSGLDVDYLFKPEGAGEGEFQTLNLGDIAAEDLAADREKKERAEEAGIDVETLTAIEKENEGLAGEGEIETSKVWVSDMVDGVPQKTGKWVEKPTKKKSLRKEFEFRGLEGDDPSAYDSSDLESMIAKYEEQLGMKKAKAADISDMLLRFAGAEGDDTMSKFQSFAKEEAKVGSRAEKIKQAAAMLGIKGEQAQKLYETKLKNTSGQTQKAVEFIMSVNPGMDYDTATRLYLRQPASFSEQLGIFKNKEGFLSDEGFLLAAGTFHRGNYKGDKRTDGSMEIGEAIELPDGIYTDKINRIIWTVKDNKVIESSGDRFKTTTE
jgi:hypothetical protein